MSTSNYWERFQRERLSRRRLLGAMGASAAGLAVAAACGGGEEGPSEGVEDQETPRPGGRLVTGTTVTPTFGLDPHTDVALGLVIFPRMYGYMLHEDPRDESLLLDHAASQPEQPDELTIVITLQPNIAYHQNTVSGLPPLPTGRVVEAEDVIQSFRRFVANPLVTGSKTWHRDFVERLEAPNPQTVRITLRRPYVYSFEALGGIQAGAIIPREHAEPLDKLNNGGIGSGPYMIERANLDAEIQVRKNPNYFRQPLPYLDSRLWRIIRDSSALKAAFVAQQVDVYLPPDKLEADDVEGERHSGAEVIVHRSPNLAYASFSMNVSKAPFNDPRVREAIDLALWREDIIEKVAFGDGEILGPINHHLRDGFWSLPAAEIEEAYGMNMPREERVARARELLEQAGQANAEIEVKYPTLPNITEGATLTQQHLQEAGLQVRLQPQELAAWFLQYREADFQATYQPHLPYEGPNIPSRFFYSKGVSGDKSFFAYSNSQVDALVERSWEEFDAEQRKQTLLELQRLILGEHGPMLNLYTGFLRTAYWSYVHGIKPELPGSLQQYTYDEFVTKNA